MTASIPVVDFTGGEWSPALNARVDLAKYQTAAKLLKNMIVHPEGGSSNRPGTRFVCECKHSDKLCRLIPFQYNVEQSYVLEFGDEYFRVIADGEQLLDGGVPVEVATDYTEDDLDLIKFTQSADVLYLAHPDYPLKKISRFSDTSWSYETVSIGSSTPAPTTLALTGGSGNSTTYAVTATINGEESLISNEAVGNDNGASMTWDAQFGVDEFNIYQKKDGIYGWIAKASGTTTSYTTDNTVDPDMDSTPPEEFNPFSNDNTLVSLSADILPSTWTHVTNMSCTATGWSASSPAYFYQGRLQYVLDDTVTAGYGLVWRGGSAYTPIIELDYTGGTGSVQVSGFSLTATDTYTSLGTAPRSFRFEGWSGSAWVILGSWSGEINWSDLEKRTFTFNNETAYDKYRLVITQRADGLDYGSMVLGQLELFTGTYEAGINNPGVVAFHQQRLVPARTDTNPQTFWGSQPSRFQNFNVSVPLRETDSYEFTISDQQINEIKWMVSFRNNLMIGTSGSEWVATGGDGGSINPTSIDVKLEGRLGSSDLPAIIIGNSILFVARGGRVISDFAYSLADDGFAGADLTLIGSHLFRERQLKEWAFQRLPDRILWCVMDDGVLLGMTYDKGQQVWAWTQHYTDGLFESIAGIRDA